MTTSQAQSPARGAVGAASSAHVPSTYTRNSGSSTRCARSSHRHRIRPSTECTNRAATGWHTATASGAMPMNAASSRLFSSIIGGERRASSMRATSPGSVERNTSQPISDTSAITMGPVTIARSTRIEPSTKPVESSGCHQRERGVRSSCGYSAPINGRSRRRPAGAGAGLCGQAAAGAAAPGGPGRGRKREQEAGERRSRIPP